MSTVGTITVGGVDWDIYEWPIDSDPARVVWQRACTAVGCDRGLLLRPARDCPACRGSGYIVSFKNPQESA